VAGAAQTYLCSWCPLGFQMKTTGFVYSCHVCLPSVHLEATVKHNASTVLLHSTFGCYFRPQPNAVVVDPLRCVNLGSAASPYYHGYGLMSSVLDRNLQVLTPVLNSMAHSGQWGL
jgi:hypothetical protein